MSDLGNREVMARNLQRLMEEHGVTRVELCEAIGVKYTTLTDWVKGNTYPRIDKIELLANYFGVEKSDLIEEKTVDEFRQRILDENHAILKALEKATPEERKTIEKIIKSIVSDD